MEQTLANTDLITLSVTIVIAIAGWIIALLLQRHNTKEQHKIQIRYDIYKQFVDLHKEAQDQLGKLAAQSRPPFILMESSMIPFQLGLKREYKGQWIPYSEQECIFEGQKKWTSFVQECFDLYSGFSNKLIQFMYVTEDWEAAISPLLPTKQVLHKEVEALKDKIHSNLNILQSYSSTSKQDWRSWNKDEIENTAQAISNDALAISSYFNDFMVLIHNELLSSYFKHERPIRKTLDPNYKVLTKNGIIEQLDHEMISKMEKWKVQLRQEAPASLQQAISNDLCPHCNASLLILGAEVNDTGTTFVFACGHKMDIVNEKVDR